jgi:hypothetical protein
MLGHHFRIRASNTQNQAITVTLKARYFKFDSAGAIVYSAEQTLISAVSVSATTGTTASSTVNNSSDLYVGAEITLSCTAAATTNSTGLISVTLERSTDTGTTWPTAEQGEPVGGYTVTAADTTNARLRNLTIY